MKQMGPESMFVEFLTWILSVNPYMPFRKFEFSKIFLSIYSFIIIGDFGS